MKRITSGQLAKAIAKINPIVTDDMVRVWCERSLIPALRNPGNDRGWWYILPDALPDALLHEIHLAPQEVRQILKVLGLLDGKQTNLFQQAPPEKS